MMYQPQRITARHLPQGERWGIAPSVAFGLGSLNGFGQTGGGIVGGAQGRQGALNVLNAGVHGVPPDRGELNLAAIVVVCAGAGEGKNWAKGGLIA